MSARSVESGVIINIILQRHAAFQSFDLDPGRAHEVRGTGVEVLHEFLLAPSPAAQALGGQVDHIAQEHFEVFFPDEVGQMPFDQHPWS